MMEHWNRKRQILQLLSADEFISGEKIANCLGLTRAAINQHIETLADYGIDIFSVKGKGYKLSNPLLLTDENKLINAIANRCFYFDEINSTNTFMLAHHHELESGDICIAEYQSAGRGRRGKQWVSPYGHHLYASMFWRFEQDPSKAMGLSLVVACAITKALEGMSINGLGLKWPNDIYLDNKKLAGILIEMAPVSHNVTELVIGFGINLSMSQSQGALIDQPWSDLTELNQLPDKTELIINIQQQLKQDIQRFDAQGLAPFMAYWNAHDLFVDKAVNLLMMPNNISGVYKGINEQGAVLIECNGKIDAYIGGEISLRQA
ncbi:bifunctional biotin--[acetyl-CoA-carboxylase] ligase/biotin operon repressor BirA [Shewanella gaetbuli]